MNKLDSATRAMMIRSLVEGNSIRATSRMTGVAINTVVKMVVDAGEACAEYLDARMQNLTCQRMQADEIWSFVGCKQKQVTAEKMEAGICGDVWTFTVIDADTRLVPCWMVGRRDAGSATEFIQDLAGRLSNRIQLTTDGDKMYLTAVPDGFGDDIDYAQLVKIYGNDPESENRYSPAVCNGCKKETKIGNPDPKHISTSYVERQNLNMRMGMRRFTRLTNAFSKKLENHMHAVALYFMFYNFVRVHQTLGKTPAMAAGIEAKKWEIADVVAMIDAYEAQKKSK
jgi:IS1 family transposase